MAKKILTLCLALVIGIAFAMPVHAAVKSIKVGGDIVIRGIYRDNFDFYKDKLSQEKDDNSAWLMTTTRVWVAADLTDNVSAVVRLLNERDWSYESDDSFGAEYENTDITLDLAYIKLKDLFYPGLTATLGRQEIMLGKGFVIGNYHGLYGSDNGAIRAFDLTARKAFDAWKLDYEVGTVPLAFTLFDIKPHETALENNDSDHNVSGLNVAWKCGDNAKIEGYVIFDDGHQSGDDYNVYTWGARVDHNVLAVPGLNYNIEAALQTGTVYSGYDQDSYAYNADVSYTFANPMMPKIGASWYYASGDKKNDDKNENYYPLYPDNLSDRIGRITYASFIANSPFTPGSNMSVPKVYGSIKPAEKHMITLAYFPMSEFAAVPSGAKKDIGWGIDAGYTYQYTEDVSLGLCVDFAQAGDGIKQFFGSAFDSDALEVIGTVAVSF